jgi:hypothetical protein
MVGKARWHRNRISNVFQEGTEGREGLHKGVRATPSVDGLELFRLDTFGSCAADGVEERWVW